MIREALSSEKPVYWEDIKPTYAEINVVHDALLTESKRVTETLYLKWSKLKELKRTNWKRYERKALGLGLRRRELWKRLRRSTTRGSAPWRS